MTSSLQALVAIAPILLAAVLLVGFRVAAKWAMPLVYLAAVVLALAVWRMDLRHVAASSVQGLFITFDILLIIFGAILLLKTLERSGGVAARERAVAVHQTRGHQGGRELHLSAERLDGARAGSPPRSSSARG